MSQCVAIVGMGYVGLPLAVAFAKAGVEVVGFDNDPAKAEAINAGRSYIRHIPDGDVAAIAAAGGLGSTTAEDLARADAILICVPTPLTRNREPEMRFVRDAADTVGDVLQPGQLVVLESTTYPGTTREVVLPRLEKNGLTAGVDFHLAYSPEREDPGSAGHTASRIPKVVGGLTPACLAAARAVYDLVVPETVPVSSLETAEATKLMENIFRCVNIALVNELKQVFARMDIDVWEVIAAAKTKPFGYMPFYPGPGLGGHCIPIDPFYLSWRARQYDCATKFIELAGEVNVAMPEYVVTRTMEELNREKKSLNGSRILVVGLAYKPDVDDVRESPSLRLIELFGRAGAEVRWHDPHVGLAAHDDLPEPPEAAAQAELTAESLAGYDAVVIATDHSSVDYRRIADAARLVVDTRNVMAGVGPGRARVAKA